jgi:competence protein ComEC
VVSEGPAGPMSVDATVTTAALDGAVPAPDAGPTVVETGKGFRIYFIDTEGGAAALMFSPTGESMLVDAGWIASRDAARVITALDLEQPGKRKIDYYLATHYHDDHVAAGPTLVKSVAIGTFIDHGANVPGNGDNYPAYRSTMMNDMGMARQMTVQAGQTLQLGAVTLTIVSAAHKVIQGSPTAIANPACAGTTAGHDVEDEDPQSIGFVARYGAFDFVATGDLTSGVEHELACPMNQIGKVELFESGQHATADSNSPEFVFGLSPSVIVVNNGPSKGGSEVVFERFKASPGLKDLWALHRTNRFDDAHNAPEPTTANTGSDDGHWVRAIGRADGSFTVTNGRTQLSRDYP